MGLSRPPPVVVLSEHFGFAEMTRTKQRYVNLPNEAELAALRELCVELLEPFRAAVGRLFVSSGFRSRAVNEALIRAGYHASRTSRHLEGRAADLVPLDCTLEHAWAVLGRLMAEGLPVDQAIVYVREAGEGWIHVQTARPGVAPRLDRLVDLVGTRELTPWAKYTGPVVLP